MNKTLQSLRFTAPLLGLVVAGAVVPGPTPAFAEPAPAAAVPGLQRVVAASPTNPASPKTVTANCPGGRRVIGAGFSITGGADQVAVGNLTPNAGLTNVTVRAYETDPTAVAWRGDAIAICAAP